MLVIGDHGLSDTKDLTGILALLKPTLPALREYCTYVDSVRRCKGAQPTANDSREWRFMPKSDKFFGPGFYLRVKSRIILINDTTDWPYKTPYYEGVFRVCNAIGYVLKGSRLLVSPVISNPIFNPFEFRLGEDVSLDECIDIARGRRLWRDMDNIHIINREAREFELDLFWCIEEVSSELFQQSLSKRELP